MSVKSELLVKPEKSVNSRLSVKPDLQTIPDLTLIHRFSLKPGVSTKADLSVETKLFLIAAICGMHMGLTIQYSIFLIKLLLNVIVP